MSKPRGDGELGFSQAMAELENVLRRIEGDEIDIDQLGRELGQAAKLLEICRKKIRRAEVEVQQIVESIEENAAEVPNEPAPAGEPPYARPPSVDPDDDLPF